MAIKNLCYVSFILSILSSYYIYGAVASKCEEGWYPYKRGLADKCFKAHDIPLNYDEAKYLCEIVHDGQIATVSFSHEQTFLAFLVFRVLQLNSTVWLGATPRATAEKSAPNQCLVLQPGSSFSGQQKDVPCNAQQGVVCQKSPDASIDASISQLRSEFNAGFKSLNEAISAELMTKIDNEHATIVDAINKLNSKCDADKNGLRRSVDDLKQQSEANHQDISSEVKTLTSKDLLLKHQFDTEMADLRWFMQTSVVTSPPSTTTTTTTTPPPPPPPSKQPPRRQPPSPPSPPATGHRPASDPSGVISEGPSYEGYAKPSHNSSTGDCFRKKGIYSVLLPKRWDAKTFLFDGTGALCFREAERYCYEQNATIVSIHSRAEHDFVINWIVQELKQTEFSSMWTGAQRNYIGKFWWADGTPFDYSNWGLGEPSKTSNGEDCVEIDMKGLARRWYDIPCNGHANYKYVVCQRWENKNYLQLFEKL